MIYNLLIKLFEQKIKKDNVFPDFNKENQILSFPCNYILDTVVFIYFDKTKILIVEKTIS